VHYVNREPFLINCGADTIEAVIHWRGGIHSTRRVRKNTTGHRRVGAEKTAEIIAQMAGRFSDEGIAFHGGDRALRRRRRLPHLTNGTDRTSFFESKAFRGGVFQFQHRHERRSKRGISRQEVGSVLSSS